MSKNHDYIVYINSFVDYKEYFSYGDVQRAIANGKIFPDPPAYRPKYTCLCCGKEIIRVNPFDSTEFCGKSCASRYAYRAKHGTVMSRRARNTGLVVHARPCGPKTTKYYERIASIIPHYNRGLSDMEISKIIGISDKYITNLRRRFNIPANYGQEPTQKLDIDNYKKKGDTP